MNLPILNRDASGKLSHPADGWYHVIPKGEFPHPESGLVQVLDDEAHQAIANRFQMESRIVGFAGLLIDKEHFSYDPDKESAAYGWLKELQNRKNGTWARIDWTPEGKAAVENGTYRFISPVWLPKEVQKLGNKKIRPLRLDTAGLTNKPNLRGMIPLSNRGQPDGDPDNKNQNQSMKKILTLLGLSEDASEEAALAELTKIKNRAADAEKFEKENKTLLDAQVEADLAKYANRIKPEARDKIKEQLLKNRTATLEILEAMPEAKGTEGMKGTKVLHDRQKAKTPEAIANRDAEQRDAKQRATVEAYKNSHKVNFETAWHACAAADPELFDPNAEKVES